MNPYYTTEEIDFLSENYKVLGAEECAKRLKEAESQSTNKFKYKK